MMPFEPISPVGNFTASPELPKPADDLRPDPTTAETFDAAFRTENTIGSLLASQEAHVADKSFDAQYDPWSEIADTPYEPYYENLAIARNKEHAAAIRADIDRENKDRDIMARSGWTGTGASFVAGTLDWPILIPGGQIYRSAKGGVSLLKTALSTGVAGGVAGAASEAMLQGTQQLRTAEESAMVIGGSAVLSGLLGAGLGKLIARPRLDDLAPRVERDFVVPDSASPDPLMPGSLRPSVEAAPGASPRAMEVADAIRQTAEEILPSQVRVQVVDSLGAPGDDGLFAIRAYHGTRHDFDRFSLDKIGTGEGEQVFGHGLYFAENEEVAAAYKSSLGGHDIYVDGKPFFVGGKKAGSTGNDIIDRALIINKGNVTPHIRSNMQLARLLDESNPAGAAKLRREADELTAFKSEVDVRPAGSLYEVDIDVEPHQLLDYDAKLADQPEMLAKVTPVLKDAGSDVTPATLRTQSGSWVYSELEAYLGSAEAASRALKDAGIPGLRFLDQGSRGGGVDPSATRNVVVFDDSRIKITHKNGEPVTAVERKAAVDQMFGVRKEGANTVAEGRFDPDTLLITIAADALDPAKTLRHESIHALKQMGLFTGKEWGTLEAAAKKQGWVESNNVRSLYEGVYKDRVTPELLTEEAIAEQFSLWRQGASKVTGVVAKLFERMQAFLERTGNALRGRGFQTADDVFAAVRGGDVAARAPGASPAAGTLPGAPGLGRATSVGASAVERADNTLKSAFGMEKAMSFQDPMLRLQTSQSPVSRRYVQELAETPLTYEKNALGEETAPGGSEMGAPGSVETRIKFHHGPLAEAVQAVDNAFLLYRKGHAKRFTGEVPMLTLKDTLTGTDSLTYRDFKGEISKALRRGDEHAIPEVAGAARIIRQTVLDPLKDEAIAAKLLPEDVTPETAASYLNRVYNKERIIAERDQVKTVIADWLEGQESINAGVRTRLAPLLEHIDTAETDIAKLEERIPKREAKLKEIEARAEEAGRVQQFAFKRALERREPIAAQRARIADLGEQIEGPLDSLASVRGLDSRITDARQIARAMREDDGGDLAAHLADVAELEEGVDDILVKAQAEIERMAESGDLPTPKVEGRYEGPALSHAEIDDVAASWQFAKEMRARRKPESLTSFVVRSGGVEDPGGDVLAMIGRKLDRPGLIRKGPDNQGPGLDLGAPAAERTNTLDAMALRAQENGFFADKPERPTISEFLDALRADAADGTVVRTDEQSYFSDLARAEQFERDLDARGLAGNTFKTEGQLRLFLGQSPSDAFAGEANAGIKALRAVRQQLGEVIGPYRDRISTLTKDARRKERSESLRQSERGVFATQSRNRGRTLADQMLERRGELDKMRADLQSKQARLADTQKAIEDEVVKYQGKSAKDAKSALEGRDEAEQLRQEKRQAAIARREDLQRRIASDENALVKTGPDQARELALADARTELAALERQLVDPKRLRGADKPVMTAARKIADQIDKEPGEIEDLADQIIDRILGTPDGRLPYDAHLNSASSHGASVEARGPLAARQFMIPDAAIERWLEGDIETLLRAYTRTMGADVELTKRFGSADMKLQIKEIAEDYARRSAAASTPAERLKLHKQRDADIRDLAAIRDRLRGTYNVPSDPNAILVRAGRVISSLNYMRMLGGMTLSAIPDVGGVVFSHGLSRVFGDGLIPLFRNWSGSRIAMNEVKMAGTALDMVLDSRAMQIADIMDDFGRHTKFERAIGTAARNFGVVSLMAPWNAAMKQFTGLVTMTRMLRAVERLGAGKTSPKEIERLAASGISEANARKIAEQFAKHGRKDGGVWFANTAEWDAGARPAIEAFRSALVRDVDRIIITPGQDRPLWMSSEVGRLVGQFKSFSIAAMQRVVIAGLQQRDMATLSGIALMTALGGLSGILKAKVAGQPGHTDWDDPKKNAQFLVEAIDRSGLTGWMMDVNSMTEKLTRGAVGLSAITGKPVSRYAQRNIASTLFGPTAGTIQEFARVAGAAASGEWNQSDTRAMRRLVPYNNLFYARQMFDQAEAGINGFLGVPKPASASAGARR